MIDIDEAIDRLVAKHNELTDAIAWIDERINEAELCRETGQVPEKQALLFCPGQPDQSIIAATYQPSPLECASMLANATGQPVRPSEVAQVMRRSWPDIKPGPELTRFISQRLRNSSHWKHVTRGRYQPKS